jgi:hypothetical protein
LKRIRCLGGCDEEILSTTVTGASLDFDKVNGSPTFVHFDEKCETITDEGRHVEHNVLTWEVRVRDVNDGSSEALHDAT